MRVSIVSGPAKRRFASRPVSASGDRLARSSMARRISSSQSSSSGATVTRPSSSAAAASSGSPVRAACARPASASPQKRLCRRRHAVHHREAAEIGVAERRCAARRCRRRAAPACRCGRRRAPARAACRQSTSRGSTIGEEAARRDVEPRQGAAQQARSSRARTSGRACASMTRRIAQHGVERAARLQQQRAELRLVGAQHQDGVVELARHRERPPRGARSLDLADGRAASASGAATVSVAVRAARSNDDIDLAVVIAARRRCGARAAAARRPWRRPAGRLRGERAGALAAPPRRSAAAARRRRRGSMPWRGRRARPRPWCRTGRRGRAAPCACR